MGHSGFLNLCCLFSLRFVFGGLSLGLGFNLLEVLLVSCGAKLFFLLSLLLLWFIIFIFWLFLGFLSCFRFHFFLVHVLLFLSFWNFTCGLCLKYFLWLFLLIIESFLSLFDLFVLLLLSLLQGLLSLCFLSLFLLQRFLGSLGLVLLFDLRYFFFAHLPKSLDGCFTLFSDIVHCGLVLVVVSLSYVLVKCLQAQSWGSS